MYCLKVKCGRAGNVSVENPWVGGGIDFRIETLRKELVKNNNYK